MTKKKQKAKSSNENIESRTLVRVAFDAARSLSIPKLIVQADELRDIRFVSQHRETESVIWLTRQVEDLPLDKVDKDAVIRLPDTTLTRMSQLKVGLLLSVMNRHLDLDESVVCLSGVAGSKRLDTLLIANAGRDFPWFRQRDIGEIPDSFSTKEVARILDIALRLAGEGREGKPIGTVIVLGDESQIEPYSRQLVLNPLKGHPQRERSVHNPDFFETVRELAGLDGGFVVSNKGFVQSAGTYFDARVKKGKLLPGLGARHAAAMSITAVTDAIAFAISASSGTVTVFHQGQAILELERPEHTSRS